VKDFSFQIEIMNLEDQRTNCPGFLDEYGIWNNGFECPSLSNQIRVCCGSDSGRYCCTLEHVHPSEKTFLSINETKLSFLKKLNFNFLTLPIQITCILIIFLLLLLILIILLICYRYRKRKKNLSKKQTLIIDHFPFSPPHHKVFFNENNQLTTSTSSSIARIPSDNYFTDWKEFFNETEQLKHVHPTISSQSNERNKYLFHGKYQQDDVIV
jgi:hypothetical protein